MSLERGRMGLYAVFAKMHQTVKSKFRCCGWFLAFKTSLEETSGRPPTPTYFLLHLLDAPSTIAIIILYVSISVDIRHHAKTEHSTARPHTCTIATETFYIKNHHHPHHKTTTTGIHWVRSSWIIPILIPRKECGAAFPCRRLGAPLLFYPLHTHIQVLSGHSIIPTERLRDFHSSIRRRFLQIHRRRFHRRHLARVSPGTSFKGHRQPLCPVCM